MALLQTPLLMKTKSLLSYLGGAIFALPALSFGQILFEENFDSDTSASWTANVSGQAEAVFGFDYSSKGIPSAPSGTGTNGLFMRANWDAASGGGISISPTGLSFTGDFRLTFDAWGNFHGGGNLASGGTGSTQINGYGIGTAGNTPQWGGGTHDSLHFGTTADGWAAQDYRVYTPAGLAADGSTVYAAEGTGNRNDTHDYYQGIGGKEAPAAQLAISSDQAGATRPGAAGMAWREIEIVKLGDTVTWSMDGLLLATVDNYSSLGLGGDNILFSHYDINTFSATDPDGMLFSLVDNARVEVIPEPSTYAAIFGGLALLGALAYRRRRA